MNLFHVSDNPRIKVFAPRPPPSADSTVKGDAVWAIDADHLAHYLLPRDCPRICLRLGPTTSTKDRAHFFKPQEERVVAVELAWYARIVAASLHLYQFDPKDFASVDSIAGYFISRHPVHPLRCDPIAHPVGEIVRRGYKFRLLPELWSLRDEVIQSTVQYSIIRMRFAKPR